MADAAAGQTTPLIPGPDKAAEVGGLQRDNFGQFRWRCITRPERAYETLSPWGTLKVQIVKGRELIASDTSMMMQPTSDPYVRVYVDDASTPVLATEYKNMTCNPTWNFTGEVPLYCPDHFIRFQVMDSDLPLKGDDYIGFVEINTLDMPLNQNIEGWFEVRFQENLQRTATLRYAAHKVRRDEDNDKAKREIKAAAAQESAKAMESAAPDRETVMSAAAPTDEEEAMQKRQQRRNQSLMGACCSVVVDQTEAAGKVIPGMSSAASAMRSLGIGQSDIRNNGGELYLRLIIEKAPQAMGFWDPTFALALSAPLPTDFGTFVVDMDKMQALDVQELYDDIMDMKRYILEDTVMSVSNTITYVLTWRNFFLSAAILAGFVLMVWVPYAGTELFPFLDVSSVPWTLSILSGSLAVWMVLLRIPSFRASVSTGGSTAAIDDDGYALVAAMRNTDEMVAFVERAVQDIPGKILPGFSMDVRDLASKCYRNGVPIWDVKTLKSKCQAQKWFQSVGKGELSVGTLVLVQTEGRGRRRALVKKVAKAGELEVAFDESTEIAKVPVDMVRERPDWAKISRIPKSLHAGIVPDALEVHVRALQPQVDSLKHTIVPVLHKVNDVFAWRTPLLSGAVLTVLVAQAAGFALLSLFGPDGETYAAALEGVEEIVVLIIGVFVLISQAGWFRFVMSILTIISRAGFCHKRKAPQCWAFYNPPHAVSTTREKPPGGPRGKKPPTATATQMSTMGTSNGAGLGFDSAAPAQSPV